MDTDEPPSTSEQVMQETELKEVKQELENNRLVKTNNIIDTQQEVGNRMIETLEQRNTDGHLDDKINGLKKALEHDREIRNKNLQSYTDVLEDMPIIPMGENTHEKNKLGFREHLDEDDSPKIKMSKALQADLKRSDKIIGGLTVSTAQVISVRDAWNNLSDAQRNLIPTLNITKVKTSIKRVGLEGTQAGSWSNERGVLTVNIDDRDIDVKNMYSTVQHETGHAEWHMLNETSPEKTNKFTDTVMNDEMRNTPVTSYTSKYLNTDELTENLWQQKVQKIKQQNKFVKSLGIDKMKDVGSKAKGELFHVYSDDEIADLKKTFVEKHEKWSKQVYANETHSALSEIVHGTSTRMKKGLKDSPNLQKYFKAYQELHET